MTNSRRPYGSGSLFARSGAWYGQWRVDGRLVKRKIGRQRRPGRADGITRSQAEARLRDLIQRVRPVPADRRVGLDELGASYLRHLEDVMQRRATTVRDYRCMLDAHLVPFFSGKTVDKIGADDVARYLAVKRRAGLSSKTVSNHLTFLHGLFRFAVRRGVASSNPVAAVERPRATPDPDVRFLDRFDLERLLSVRGEGPFAELDPVVYLVASMTGLRQGELVALRWRDVDFTASVIRVRRSYTRGQFSSPKSRRSARAVPMAARVREALEALRDSTAFRDQQDLVFGHPLLGTPLDASALRLRFREALEQSGVRRVRFHDLRHTYGTLMASAGTPLRALQEWMGHRDFKTTLIYADYAPDPHQGARFTERAFGPPAN